jgi:hypothetical protein
MLLCSLSTRGRSRFYWQLWSKIISVHCFDGRVFGYSKLFWCSLLFVPLLELVSFQRQYTLVGHPFASVLDLFVLHVDAPCAP